MDSTKFRRLVVQAGLVDDGYPLASLVWRPRGVQVLRAFSQRARQMLQDLGYEEHAFPSIAASHEFDRVNTQVHDFSKGVLRPNETMVLRPSGESVLYPMFRRWIRTRADLPLRAFEVGRSIRAGRAQGLFRQTESALFIEAHSAHASEDDARAQCAANVSALGRFLTSCGVPAVHVVRPTHTNKPVALVHHGFDVMLPSGQSLLVGSAYEQGQIFSRAFNVKFSDGPGQSDHTWQTELGFSHRVILASLWLTGDDKGLCLLPALAPNAVTVVQIGDTPRTAETAQGLVAALRKAGVSTALAMSGKDDLGRLRNRIELEGTPVRIEVGAREADAGQLMAKGRDGSSEPCTPGDATGVLEGMLAGIQQRLLARAADRCTALTQEDVAPAGLAQVLKGGRCASTTLCQKPSCIDSLEALVGIGEVLGHRPRTGMRRCGICTDFTALEAFVARRI